MMRAMLEQTAARIGVHPPPAVAAWLAGSSTIRPMAAYLAAHEEWRRADEVLVVLHPIAPGDDACHLAAQENFYCAVMTVIESELSRVIDLTRTLASVVEHCAAALMWHDAYADAGTDCPASFQRHARQLLDAHMREAANG